MNLFLVGSLGCISSIIALFCAVEINEYKLLLWSSLIIAFLYISFIFKPEQTENLFIISFFISANLLGRGIVESCESFLLAYL